MEDRGFCAHGQSGLQGYYSVSRLSIYFRTEDAEVPQPAT